MRKDNLNKSYSIRTRVVSAFLIFAVLQSVIFFVLMYATGILKLIYNQSYSSFNSQVTARANALSETMNNAKSGFIHVARQINRTVSMDSEKSQNLMLSEATEQLIEFLNATKDISGVFVILESDYSENSDSVKDCVYIRDNNYGGYIRGADSKIYVCGPSQIAKEYNYQLFHLWEQRLDLTELENSDFYTKPIIAAKNFNVSYNNMFYWSRPFRLKSNDADIITFSLPLIDENNKPFGVCGFEISAEFLKKMLPYNELSGNYNLYAVNDGDVKSTNRVSSGAVSEQLFYSDKINIQNINNDFNPVKVTGSKTLPAMIGIEKKLEIYGSSSVYGNENWSLYGFTDEDYLIKYPRSLIYYLVMAQIIILIISIIYIITVSLKITHPIKALSGIITSLDIDAEINLPVTRIKEIDELTNALQIMNKSATASASRLNTLIKMAGISMGGFETRGEAENAEVYLTNAMPGLIGLDDSVKRIGKSEWDGIMQKLGLLKSDDVCRFIDRRNGTEHWLRLKKTENSDNRSNESNESGIIMDVSSEITMLRKTQYERDYDSLTQALNRRAFFEALNERIGNGVYRAGALVVIDLDNLKYINDSYGHETGDLYLIKTADVLKEFEKRGGLVSRMAGDEFILFVPCETAEQKEYISLKTDIALILERCKMKSIPLPNNEKQRLRFSAGIAWYPADTSDLELLTKYADFAMYEIKHNIKGSVGEFSLDSYNKKSYLINKQETLDHLIETESFRYMLQPIIDGKTGDVFAYEMLIRSDADGLKTPYEILSVAKQQSKLYYLEIIGLKNLFKLLRENENQLKGKLIFYNIVKSVVLRNDDWNMLIDDYKKFFPQIVMEIAEDGEFDETLHKEREKHFHSFGIKTSLDNFGSGYNSETFIARLNPDFLKISMPLIRDINLDGNKRALVKNITEYCASHNVKIIAQGVETYEEMLTVRELGINYYQGFYLARPSYEISGVPQNIKKQILDKTKN